MAKKREKNKYIKNYKQKEASLHSWHWLSCHGAAAAAEEGVLWTLFSQTHSLGVRFTCRVGKLCCPLSNKRRKRTKHYSNYYHFSVSALPGRSVSMIYYFGRHSPLWKNIKNLLQYQWRHMSVVGWLMHGKSIHSCTHTHIYGNNCHIGWPVCWVIY